MLATAVTTLITLMLAALLGAPVPGHGPALRHHHSLDMEQGHIDVPPGVTPLQERVSPRNDSGGAGLEYLAGSKKTTTSSTLGS